MKLHVIDGLRRRGDAMVHSGRRWAWTWAWAMALALVAVSGSVRAVSAAATAPPAPNAAIPDFTQGDTVPEGFTHDWNLGPTGARGWIYSRRMETAEARQILVTEVAPGSPADGVLVPGDVIVGVTGRAFTTDARVAFGRAIGDAEARNGMLAIERWRDGRTTTERIRLEDLGAYRATAPFDCPKSRRILERGFEALARRMEVEPNRGHPIVRSYNALALLASGDERYLPLVEQQVAFAANFSDLERRSLHSWSYGPLTILVAEYVMATGDERYRPALERLALEIANGQSPVGSWGHRFIQRNGRLAGYGMMNAPGIPLTLAMVLAREAGVDDPKLDEAIAKSAALIRFYVGKGSVPYGDHAPWIDTHDDNGKNGAAAVLFDLLGDVEAATYFTHMSVASHGGERDHGHTGNFFNMLWALPAVALAGPEATGAWMREFAWGYDLARRWDGSFIHQGPPQPRPDSYRGWDCTGAYLLGYAQPLRTLVLTGRTDGVVERINRRTARQLVDDGRGWTSLDKGSIYADRSDAELVAGLRSWSPVVRERSGLAIARRDGDPVPVLVGLLDDDALETRLGACQALQAMGRRAEPAIPALRQTLRADDLWLRIKAAEALAAIGPPALVAAPDLLGMLAEGPDDADPRGMQQRYLSFALFNRRGGLLGRSLDGVGPELVRTAVEAGLRNEDGRARGSLGSVYGLLSLRQLAPILPAIHEAILEPSPSGIMFADGIRLSGLELFAQHRIAEGVPLCVELIDPDRWGMGNRIAQCLNALRTYGGAARSEVPRLRALHDDLVRRNWNPSRLAELDIPGLIADLEADTDAAPLRSLANVARGG